MKPHALLEEALRNYAVAEFQQLGFIFESKHPSLRRDRSRFVDCIKFNIDQLSDDDTCQFTTHWSVESPLFVAKHKEIWGDATLSGPIAGLQDWLIMGWPRSSLGFRLLQDPTRCAHEMRELIDSAKLIGIPFLESICSFDNAAEFLLDRNMNTDLVCALFIMSGQVDRARHTLETAIAQVESRNLSGKAVALAHLEKLREKYFT